MPKQSGLLKAVKLRLLEELSLLEELRLLVELRLLGDFEEWVLALRVWNRLALLGVPPLPYPDMFLGE